MSRGAVEENPDVSGSSVCFKNVTPHSLKSDLVCFVDNIGDSKFFLRGVVGLENANPQPSQQKTSFFSLGNLMASVVGCSTGGASDDQRRC